MGICPHQFGGCQRVNSILFSDYSSNWFDLYVVGKVKKTTQVRYKSYLKVHLLPYFGDLCIDKITRAVVQRFINNSSIKGSKTLHNVLQFLNRIFDAAVDDGYLQNNPSRSSQIILPKNNSKERKALTESEVRDILLNICKLSDPDRLLICLLIFTGMRRGELLGLKWDDVDLTSKLISISRNATYPSTNQAIIESPKPKKGYRQIPIIDYLNEILVRQQKHDGFIIGHSNKPISLQQYRNTMNRIGNVIDLHDATAHIFRHTLLTMASNSGIEPKMLQALAGHSNMAFTLDRYVHVQTDQHFLFDLCDTEDNLLIYRHK